MADLTHGAVDKLLGILSGAIKDEAQLLSGVQGDIQFIRDEMDSMNGFLLHLTKSGDDHDDQQRAWMKQVRDIAYIAQDCIELYMRDLAPPEKGIWARMRHVPVLLKTWWPRHRLANRLRDLKVRVRDVGERRQRYGVTVPEAKKGNTNKNATGLHGGKGVVEAREAFLKDLASRARSEGSFRNAIVTMLAECYLKPAAETSSSSLGEVERLIQNALPEGDENAIICMEMLLRALQVAPRGQGRVSKQELHDLNLITSPSSSSSDLKTASSDESADDLHFRVMVLCYSKLSYDYKSCLQYLTAFLNEKSISRTSLVRRWAAERLVGVAKEDEKQSHEKAAENCFNELLFRGFISPVEHGAAGNKVKSCMMRGQVKEFIEQISKSENFEGSHLPTHLDNHLRIRQMVDAQQKKLELAQDQHSADAAACPNTCGLFSLQIRKQEDKRPIDELLNHLRSLPETYRLNVLDLGGCRGLKERHLKSICDCKTMQTLRYLSLRNTDISSLPKQIRELWLLETLDIRQTMIQASCTESIYLRKLKHLLAGDGSTASRTGELLSTVRMPTNISKMTDMEVLSCVQISRGNELSKVEDLKKLRKLGVLLPGSEDIIDLGQAISKMGGRLQSLSIWIDINTTDGVSLDKKDGDGTFLHLENLESLSITGMYKYGLPSWVDEGLKKLSKITLCKTHVTHGKLETLSKLTGLLCLRLHHGSFMEEELAFRADGFIALKFLLLESAATTKLTFEENASPQLEKIVWSIMDAKVAATASAPGIEHLAGLKQVVLKGLREGDSCPLVENAIAKHPKHRAIEFIIGVGKIVAVTSTT